VFAEDATLWIAADQDAAATSASRLSSAAIFLQRTKRMRCRFAAACLMSLLLSHGQASAQARDSLLNGALIGGAIGAGIGVGFTHAVRDSDLTFGQYAYGGLVFGAIGAGAGLGVDALLNRSPRPFASRSLLVAPAVGHVNGVAVVWRWGSMKAPSLSRVVRISSHAYRVAS
jgi:hypothetical protein